MTHYDPLAAAAFASYLDAPEPDRYYAQHVASLGDDAVPCPVCFGRGGSLDDGDNWNDCTTCFGSCEVSPRHAAALERRAAALRGKPCPSCMGRGWLISGVYNSAGYVGDERATCRSCDGSGTTRRWDDGGASEAAESRQERLPWTL